MKATITCLILLMFSTAANASTQSARPGNIIVTIKPLFSLVAHLTEGIQEPTLLMKQAQSPHHYNMRPSERRLLADASMIVWVGPQMETYLSKVIQQHTSIEVRVLQAKGIHLHAMRKTDEHQPQHEHVHDASHSDQHEQNLDPHIWLSTSNAIAISKHIAEQLILNEPSHSEKYKDNLEKLIKKISQTADGASALLKNSKQPFISYHDAFQYFENEHQLKHVDSIVFNEETGVSLKQLSHIKSQIKKKNIQCLVFQQPKPDIINTLTDQTTIKTAALDPLGLQVKNDKNAWFEIIQQTTLNFKRCLTP